MTKRALITGITGLDAAYLSELLLSKGYEVFDTYRRSSTPNFWRLQHLDIFEKIQFIPADLLDSSSLLEAVKTSDPSEVYNLAAQSYVGISFETPIATGIVSGIGVTTLLETIKNYNTKIKFYQASTSEMFGLVQETPQNEETPFYPRSPYGVAKLFAHWMVKNYRESYNLFCCSGILFNHESEYRGAEFVTQKIIRKVVSISLGDEIPLVLGNNQALADDHCLISQQPNNKCDTWKWHFRWGQVLLL